jgi:hypothetical protein
MGSAETIEQIGEHLGRVLGIAHAQVEVGRWAKETRSPGRDRDLGGCCGTPEPEAPIYAAFRSHQAGERLTPLTGVGQHDPHETAEDAAPSMCRVDPDATDRGHRGGSRRLSRRARQRHIAGEDTAVAHEAVVIDGNPGSACFQVWPPVLVGLGRGRLQEGDRDRPDPGLVLAGVDETDIDSHIFSLVVGRPGMSTNYDPAFPRGTG